MNTQIIKIRSLSQKVINIFHPTSFFFKKLLVRSWKKAAVKKLIFESFFQDFRTYWTGGFLGSYAALPFYLFMVDAIMQPFLNLKSSQSSQWTWKKNFSNNQYIFHMFILSSDPVYIELFDHLQ